MTTGIEGRSNVVSLADHTAAQPATISIIAYTKAIAEGHNPLEEKGGPRDMDHDTLAFLADVERVRDEGYRGDNSAFMRAFRTVMQNAQEEEDNVVEAVEDWLRASITELDQERERVPLVRRMS